MTLSQSSEKHFNVWKYSLYLLRRYTWMLVVFGLPGIFCGPLLIGMMLRMYIKEAMTNPEVTGSLVQNMLDLYRNMGMIPLYLWAIAFGFVLAMVMGAYLHSRKQVDFYHALPVTRNQYFVAQILASFLIFLITTVALLLMILVVAMVFVNSAPVGTIIYWLCIHLLQMSLIFLASYLLTAIAGQLTGTVASHGAMAVVLQVGLFIWAAFTILLLSIKFETYSGAHEATLLGQIFSHSTLITTAGTFGYSWKFINGGNLDTPFLSSTSYVILLVIIIGGFFFNRWLYAKRPLERAGQTLIYNVERYVLKAYFIYLATLVGALMVEAILGVSSLAFALVGGFLTAAFAHVVMEMAFNRDVRSFRRGIASSLVMFVAVSGFYVALDKDPMHYDEYVPKAEQLSWMNWTLNDNPTVKIEDPALMQEVLAINEKLVENAVEKDNWAEGITPFNGVPMIQGKDDVIWQSNAFYSDNEYHMKRGLPKTRYNTGTMPEGSAAIFKKIYDNKAFREAYYQHLFAEKPDFSEFTLAVVADNLPKQDEGLRAYQMISRDAGITGGEAELKDAKTLLDALKADIQQRSYEDTLGSPLYTLNLTNSASSHFPIGQAQTIPIYANDKNTMQVVQKWVAEGKVLSADRALEASYWSKNLYRAHFDESGSKLILDEQVTDPDEIKQLLRSTRTEDMFMTEPLYEMNTKKVLAYRGNIEEDYIGTELRFFVNDVDA